VHRPGITSQELADLLSVDKTEISRTGGRLVDAGLARRRKAGRNAHWEITPRGRHSLRTPGPIDEQYYGAETRNDVVITMDLDAAHRFAMDWETLQGLRESIDLQDPVFASAQSRIFSAIVSAHGPTSPERISNELGIKGEVVDDLLGVLAGRGYVRRSNADQEDLGDGAVEVEVNTDDYGALGVEVLEDRLVGVVTDLRANTRRGPIEHELTSKRPEDVLEGILSLTARLREPTEDFAPTYTVGIGVELPGHVDSEGGEVVLSPNMGWDSPVPLSDDLHRLTGIPTVVENDANALAIYEQLFGAGRSESAFIVVLVGEGVGAGIVADRALLHGGGGAAGEIGHVYVAGNDLECRCTKRGCLESIASARAIVRAAEAGRPKSMRAIRTIDEAVGAAQEDPGVLRVFENAGRALGSVVSGLLNEINPGLVLFLVPEPLTLPLEWRAAAAFTEALKDEARCHTFSKAYTDARIEFKAHGTDDAQGAQGAAAALLRNLIRAPQQWPPVATERVRPASSEGSVAPGVIDLATVEAAEPSPRPPTDLNRSAQVVVHIVSDDAEDVPLGMIEVVGERVSSLLTEADVGTSA
jgi:predicted NBD/HSP70 family sugar kinase/DNA-binding MarR family transcriptional regulator